MEVVRLVEGAVLKTVGANHTQGFNSSCFRKRVWYNGIMTAFQADDASPILATRSDN